MIDPLTEPIDWDEEEKKRQLQDGYYLVEAQVWEEDFVTSRSGEEVKIVRLPLKVLEEGFENRNLRDTFWLSSEASWRIDQAAYAFSVPLKHTDGKNKTRKELFNEFVGKVCKVQIRVEDYEDADGRTRYRSTVRRYHGENFVPREPLFAKPPAEHSSPGATEATPKKKGMFG